MDANKRQSSEAGKDAAQCRTAPARWVAPSGPVRVGARCRGVQAAGVLLMFLLALGSSEVFGAVIYEATSTYHHIQVVDEGGFRTLRFDGAQESRMLVADPVRGHFEYTEFFHLPWLWNGTMTNVLMVGLGGASTQRTYAHYYPQVAIETSELDPAVLRVAREYFILRETPRQVVHIEDGRAFLRRTRGVYGAILMDAYTANRYGSYVPYHLVTKEFFTLASEHLTTNGVLCYNITGTVGGAQSDLMGAVHRTLASVFPQVYIFPARESYNVVLVATRTPQRWTPVALQARGRQLAQLGQVRLPGFAARIQSLTPQPPAAYAQALVLEDDFAPTDGLLRVFSAASRQSAPTAAP